MVTRRRELVLSKVSCIVLEMALGKNCILSITIKNGGGPVHDDRHLFEMLILEDAQAGLS